MKRISVRAIIENNDTYFFTRLVGAESFLCLPGGGVEQGEDLLTAFKREIVEELGIEPEVGNLLYVHQLIKTDGSVDSTSFFFHVKNSQDYAYIDLSKTTHGEQEIVEYGFYDPALVHVLPSFLKTELAELKKANFSLPTRLKITPFEQ